MRACSARFPAGRPDHRTSHERTVSSHLDNLTIGYDSQPVLSGISLSIARASFTAILGANGSGKSTLLKTLLGLQPPIAGPIQIARCRAVFGYVPQTIQFDPLYPLTGFDVALMGVSGASAPAALFQRNERAFVRECLRATGAEEFARKRFAELSGGQKAARAHRPRTGHQARRARARRADRRRGRRRDARAAGVHFADPRERKLTILLVTHDLPLVRKHAQQVIWLHQGKVLHGTVAELFTPERMAEIFEMEVG